MKLLIGFFAGIVCAAVLLYGMQAALPISAQTENTPATDNFSLVDLLPDIEKIYDEALTSPLNEAKKNIYDEDIANYYQRLLEKTELDRPTD
ncbi:MAG: hypothetical protein ABID87_01100 [Chloroflexota bacterium]